MARPFPKGVSGNPKGRPKDPIELILTKQMSQAEFRIMMNKILQAKPEDLKDFRGTALERAIASIVEHAIKTGDPTRIEFFLQRMFGKVPDKIEVTAVDELKQLSDEELLERVVSSVEEFKVKLLKGGSNE